MPRPTAAASAPALLGALLALAACRGAGAASEEVRPALPSAGSASTSEPASEERPHERAPSVDPMGEPSGAEPALRAEAPPRATEGEEPPRALGPDPEGGLSLEVAGRPAFLALPRAEPPRPAVLVVRETGRVSAPARELARRIADEGFAALALDVVTPPPEGDPERSRAQALAELASALRFLRDDPRVRAPRVAAMGFGAQGGLLLELALGAPDLAALALVQTPLITDEERLLPLRAAVLGLFGSRDAAVPPDRVADFVDALKTTGKSAEVRMYDAGHGFADPRSPGHDAAAARAAWEELRSFLGRTLR